MPKFKATAYIRLSYTDDHSSESDSVSNQRKLIENFVEHNPDIEVVSEKIDDGYSGIIFDRPAFKEMMQDVTDGNINCVIVKDLSRLGREYIETGRYLRRVFPAYGVRFIAITDSIDTAHDSGDDLAVSVKNIMNEALNAEIMEFIDNGYSGTNFERPQVQKLIELVRANQIDCIIVKDFSRFGRNSIETGYFIERVFPLFHTRFISISDDFDSSKFKGDTGGMDVAFKYLISEYYSRDMSIKTKSAKYAKMQRGEYQSKICPYGYRKSADGRMEPDPEAAAVVQLIFQLAAEGINATAITRELFRRSIPTPGQYKAAHGNHTHDISRCHGIWSTSTILRILEDERYTGVYVIGKRAVLEVGGTRSRLKDRESWYIISDHHPAIVERAVFDTVQTSQLRFSQPNKKKRDYPLKGKAFCGCCGHALSRTMQKTSYYHCRHSEADVESRCHKMRLNAAELEQAVFLTLKKQMKAAAPLAPDGTLRVDASVPERTEYEQQIEALQDGKRALYERYLMGEIDLNTYKAEKTACDELLLKTKNAYAAVLAQAKQKQDEQARQDSRMEASKAIFDADTLTTELAELLIDRVLVYPDKRIEIAYKIQDIFD